MTLVLYISVLTGEQPDPGGLKGSGLFLFKRPIALHGGSQMHYELGSLFQRPD